MTPDDEARISEFNAALDGELSLRLHLPDDSRAGELNAFSKRLTQLAPKIAAQVVKDGTGTHPAILVGPRLVYHAVPSDRELEPFLRALSYLNSNSTEIDSSMAQILEDVHLPAELRIYVVPSCPFCPGVLQQLLPLPFAVPALQLTVVDGMLFPELAEQDTIQSVPTVILDDAFRWTGQIALSDIIDTLIHRDPARLKQSTLQRLLLDEKVGGYRLAAMMDCRKMIFPAVYDLLLEETFTIRLAAMVAMETLAEENITLALTALPTLLNRFNDAPDPVKGDLLYILGELKSGSAKPFIEAVVEGNYAEEIKEAAQEALEILQVEESS